MFAKDKNMPLNNSNVLFTPTMPSTPNAFDAQTDEMSTKIESMNLDSGMDTSIPISTSSIGQEKETVRGEQIDIPQD